MKRKFIINKAFSINSDEDFRNYAHNLMKNAHGDEYSKEVTDKVVDDLLKDNSNADYGELIGRLTSGFGEKSFGYIDGNYTNSKIKQLEKEYEDLKKKNREYFKSHADDVDIDDWCDKADAEEYLIQLKIEKEQTVLRHKAELEDIEARLSDCKKRIK
jgi:hypothetical protein